MKEADPEKPQQIKTKPRLDRPELTCPPPWLAEPEEYDQQGKPWPNARWCVTCPSSTGRGRHLVACFLSEEDARLIAGAHETKRRLAEAREFADDRSDVQGDSQSLKPNDWMRLLTLIDQGHP